MPHGGAEKKKRLGHFAFVVAWMYAAEIIIPSEAVTRKTNVISLIWNLKKYNMNLLTRQKYSQT